MVPRNRVATVPSENRGERKIMQNVPEAGSCLWGKSEHISYFFLAKNLEIFRFLSYELKVR